MASAVGSTKPDFLPKIVLDGQQRITSLGKVFDPESPKQDRVLFNVISEAFEGYSPRKLLNQRGVDRYLRDEMANIAFLGERANRRIRASEPKDYLLPIKQQAQERLKAQFVPLDESLWSLDRFEDFLQARRILLAEAMNQILYG